MIRDLLAPNSGFLELREDPKGVNVVGLMEVETSSVEEVRGREGRVCECCLQRHITASTHWFCKDSARSSTLTTDHGSPLGWQQPKDM